MPRPAGFDRDEALRRATETFWRQGYNATSMKDLTRAMGLQPGSLYGAFRSKRALFLEALESYYASNISGLNDRLCQDAPPMERIRSVFERIAEQGIDDPDGKGCMMVNTLLEMPVDDDEINGRLQQMFKTVEGRLEEAIKEAQSLNHIRHDKDAKSLAHVLLMGMHGLRVFSKTRPEPKALHESVDGLLSVLSN